MIITLTKKAGKPHVLRCRRDDGSDTWFQASQTTSDFFAAHDLAHYVVERMLGYRSAFYGMIAAGRDINDFGSDAGLTGEVLAPEAHWAEQLVGLLLTCRRDSLGFTKFSEMLSMVSDPTPPAISKEQFEEMSRQLSALLDRWSDLPIDAALTLEF